MSEEPEPTKAVRCALALALVFAATACDDSLEVDYRGRRKLAEGNFRVALPLLFGSERYVLASDEDRGALVLVPFDGSKACELGNASRAVAYWTSDGLRVGMFHEEEDGSESVQFFDADCEPHLDPVSGIVSSTFASGSVLAETIEGHLLAIDPWRDRVRVVSEGFARRGPYARDLLGNTIGVWLLEGDSLLRRDFEGEALGEPIEGVTALTAVSDGAEELVYVDGEGTHLLSVDREEHRRLYDPGCGPRLELRAAWLEHEGPRRVTLLSPCEERRLVAIDLPEGGESVAPVVTTYASNVASWWHRTVLLPFEPGTLELFGTWTFYRTPGESEGDPERVWVAPPDGEAAELGVDIDSGSRLWPWLGAPDRAAWTSSHGRWLAVTRDAVLGTWSSEDGFEPIAEQVERLGLAELDAAPSYAWVTLHAVTDGVGTLSRVSASGVLETLATEVPPEGVLDFSPASGGAGVIRLEPPDYDAVVRRSDGSTGELVLLGPEMTTIATGVPPDAVRVFKIELRGTDLAQEAEPMGALGYLHDFDSEDEVGALSVRLEDDRSFAIDEDVSGYRPSSDYFEPGIVYTIGVGERRGLWFAAQ